MVRTHSRYMALWDSLTHLASPLWRPRKTPIQSLTHTTPIGRSGVTYPFQSSTLAFRLLHAFPIPLVEGEHAAMASLSLLSEPPSSPPCTPIPRAPRAQKRRPQDPDKSPPCKEASVLLSEPWQARRLVGINYIHIHPASGLRPQQNSTPSSSSISLILGNSSATTYCLRTPSSLLLLLKLVQKVLTFPCLRAPRTPRTPRARVHAPRALRMPRVHAPRMPRVGRQQ